MRGLLYPHGLIRVGFPVNQCEVARHLGTGGSGSRDEPANFPSAETSSLGQIVTPSLGVGCACFLSLRLYAVCMMKQPERDCPHDGPVETRRTIYAQREGLMIGVTQDGVYSVLYVSYFNAFRLFTQLALVLDIPLTKKVRKTIRIL